MTYEQRINKAIIHVKGAIATLKSITDERFELPFIYNDLCRIKDRIENCKEEG